MQQVLKQLKARLDYCKQVNTEIKPVGYRLATNPSKRNINAFFDSLPPNKLM